MAELVFNIDNTALETVNGLQISANFEEMKVALTELVEPYKNMVVSEEDVASAKTDRAKIRKLITNIDDRRKMVKKIYTAPLVAFEDKCKELTAICAEGATNLDDQIKEYEGKAKREKMQKLTEYFDSHNEYPQYISIENVANPKWVNVTYPFETAQLEIDNALLRVKEEVSAIKGLNSKYEDRLFEVYAQTHNITAVLKQKAEFEAIEQLALKTAEEAKSKPKPAPVVTTNIVDRRDDELLNCPCCGSTDYEVIYVQKISDEVVGCSDCIFEVDDPEKDIEKSNRWPYILFYNEISLKDDDKLIEE